jgi:hypothetical protein
MNRVLTLFYLVLALGLAASPARAGEPNFEAEDQQAAQEEEKAIADRLKGIKSNIKLVGRYIPLPETTKDLNPTVVGSFVTISEDNKPGATYLVKVEKQNKDILEALKLSEGKNVQLSGKLRNLDENGVAKYFIVSIVTELAPTPRAVERRKLGGL